MRRLLCTLEDSEFAVRGSEWRTLLSVATSRAPTADGVRLVFPSDPAVAAALDDLMAKEASCCSWMTFDVERTPQVIVVSVSGPVEARDGLVATFAASAS